MEHKWTAIALISILTIIGCNEAYDRYLENQIQMAKVQHGCVAEVK